MKTFVHFCRILAGVDQPETQVTKDELSLLLTYSRGAERVVEIGCFEGATTTALASNTKGRVYSIDLFLSGRTGICFSYWIARVEMFRKKLGNIQLIKGASYDAVKQIGFEIDFLFIDGDHTWEGIERDWSDWFPKVKAGGIIALHDSRISKNSPKELGSMQYYRKHLKTLKGLAEMEGVDSLAVFKKLQ